MASQSLYRKWRSQTFSDLIGQEATVRTLLNAVRDKRLAHAYLFCGPRGTGKTSAARLLAKAINCANPRDGEPCNECVSCREIAAGHSPDVIEIDAASNTGVDNIRDLRENVNLLGSGGHYKVYVVDECHMLSTAAFNALLKTLEEPPPHVIFVLATTEAQKVLPTVVSRCQRFDFRRFSMRDLVARLRYVAEQEGLALDLNAADLLARAAQGGMRDALSLLDQAMAYCGTQIDLERVRAMLGVADPGAIRAILVAVADQRAADALQTLNELVLTGADLRQLQQQLAEEWRALLLARAGADIALVMDRTTDEARELTALAGRFSLEELTECARVFSRSEGPARGLPVPQLATELLLLDCLAIRRRGGAPTQPVSQPSASQPNASQPAAQRPAVVASQPAPAARVVAPAPSVRPSAPTTVPDEIDMDAIERALAEDAALAPSATPPATLMERERLVEQPTQETPAPVASDEPARTPRVDGATPEVVGSLDAAQREWMTIRKVCKQKSPSVAALLSSARPVMLEPGSPPTLVLQVDFQFHLEKLRLPASRGPIEWALAQVLETPMRLKFVLVGAGGGSGGPDSNSGNGAGNGALPKRPSGPQGGATRGPTAISRAAPSASADGVAQAPLADQRAAYHIPSPAPASQLTSVAGAVPSEPRQTPRHAPPHPADALEGAHGKRTQAEEALAAEARADPVVQTVLQTLGAVLVEVRPLTQREDEAV